MSKYRKLYPEQDLSRYLEDPDVISQYILAREKRHEVIAEFGSQ